MNANVELNAFMNFETNVTNLDRIKTKAFDLQIGEEIKSECFFINHDELNKLYLSCSTSNKGSYHIGEIKGFEVNDIHYKYNFIFLTQDINKNLSITEPMSVNIVHSHPQKLYFTTLDSFSFYIFTPMANLIKNIRLNENGEDLDCVDVSTIKKCTIKKEHFKDKESGYYLIHHKNNDGKYVANYEDFGININIKTPTPTPTPDKSIKLNQFSFGLLVLLCLLI